MKAGNGLAALAEAETEPPARGDNGIGAGTGSVEPRFAAIGLLAPESIDLGFDSVVKVANELAQLIEVAAEHAQVDAEVGPAAVMELAPETAEAPESVARVRQQVDHGAGLVDSVGLRGLMEALSACAEMAGNENELLQPIDFGIGFPQVLSPVLEPAAVVKTVIALAEEVMAGMTSQKPVGPGIALVELVVPPEMIVHGWWEILSDQNLREHLLGVDLMEPEENLVDWGLTVLAAALGNTGSSGHSGRLCLKHFD